MADKMRPRTKQQVSVCGTGVNIIYIMGIYNNLDIKLRNSLEDIKEMNMNIIIIEHILDKLRERKNIVMEHMEASSSRDHLSRDISVIENILESLLFNKKMKIEELDSIYLYNGTELDKQMEESSREYLENKNILDLILEKI